MKGFKTKPSFLPTANALTALSTTIYEIKLNKKDGEYPNHTVIKLDDFLQLGQKETIKNKISKSSDQRQIASYEILLKALEIIELMQSIAKSNKITDEQATNIIREISETIDSKEREEVLQKHNMPKNQLLDKIFPSMITNILQAIHDHNLSTKATNAKVGSLASAISFVVNKGLNVEIEKEKSNLPLYQYTLEQYEANELIIHAILDLALDQSFKPNKDNILDTFKQKYLDARSVICNDHPEAGPAEELWNDNKAERKKFLAGEELKISYNNDFMNPDIIAKFSLFPSLMSQINITTKIYLKTNESVLENATTGLNGNKFFNTVLTARAMMLKTKAAIKPNNKNAQKAEKDTPININDFLNLSQEDKIKKKITDAKEGNKKLDIHYETNDIKFYNTLIRVLKITDTILKNFEKKAQITNEQAHQVLLAICSKQESEEKIFQKYNTSKDAFLAKIAPSFISQLLSMMFEKDMNLEKLTYIQFKNNFNSLPSNKIIVDLGKDNNGKKLELNLKDYILKENPIISRAIETILILATDKDLQITLKNLFKHFAERLLENIYDDAINAESLYHLKYLTQYFDKKSENSALYPKLINQIESTIKLEFHNPDTIYFNINATAKDGYEFYAKVSRPTKFIKDATPEELKKFESYPELPAEYTLDELAEMEERLLTEQVKMEELNSTIEPIKLRPLFKRDELKKLNNIKAQEDIPHWAKYEYGDNLSIHDFKNPPIEYVYDFHYYVEDIFIPTNYIGHAKD